MTEGRSKEEIKDTLRYLKILAINVENWKYVSANAEYLTKKEVADALEQVLGQLEPALKSAQGSVEIEALTTLDPYDLI